MSSGKKPNADQFASTCLNNASIMNNPSGIIVQANNKYLWISLSFLYLFRLIRKTTNTKGENMNSCDKKYGIKVLIGSSFGCSIPCVIWNR
ncbi:MAG: hypothetical protein N2746_02830 [Deltaproteobacteria bacterium]|nr:hypothetical protein [Deltaproteobacteria bacterium]